jgi:hypothetical protein
VKMYVAFIIALWTVRIGELINSHAMSSFLN